MPNRHMEVISSLTKYFWAKALGAFVAYEGYVFFVADDDHIRALYGLVYMIMLDTLLGLWEALRSRRLASWRMAKPFARKIILYTAAIGATFILHSSSDGFAWVPTTTIMFFIISELLSVFEKLSLFGLPLPLRMVSKINVLFEQMATGDAKAGEDIRKKTM